MASRLENLKTTRRMAAGIESAPMDYTRAHLDWEARQPSVRWTDERVTAVDLPAVSEEMEASR